MLGLNIGGRSVALNTRCHGSASTRCRSAAPLAAAGTQARPPALLERHRPWREPHGLERRRGPAPARRSTRRRDGQQRRGAAAVRSARAAQSRPRRTRSRRSGPATTSSSTISTSSRRGHALRLRRGTRARRDRAAGTRGVLDPVGTATLMRLWSGLDALGVCLFAATPTRPLSLADVEDLVAAVTGGRPDVLRSGCAAAALAAGDQRPAGPASTGTRCRTGSSPSRSRPADGPVRCWTAPRFARRRTRDSSRIDADADLSRRGLLMGSLTGWSRSSPVVDRVSARRPRPGCRRPGRPGRRRWISIRRTRPRARCIRGIKADVTDGASLDAAMATGRRRRSAASTSWSTAPGSARSATSRPTTTPSGPGCWTST